MSRLDLREYRWFVLCTPPQREFLAELLLSREGFATFIPTRREWRFNNHVARMKRIKTERTYPLMPRYLFVGMSDHTPGWRGIFRFGVVTSVIGVDNVPEVVRYQPLHDLMQRHNAGRFRAPLAHQYMQTHREFKVGDRVLTDDGLFEGKVKEIKGNMAKVFIEIFGRTTQFEVPLDKLVAE